MTSTVSGIYEAVPSNIPSQELDLSTSNPTPIEIDQPICSVNNVPSAPPPVSVSTDAPQWNVFVPLPQVSFPSTFHLTFLKGKPFALGLVLIFAATVNSILGIGMIVTARGLSLLSGNPCWASVAYIITGILTISAHSKPSICLVRGSLAMSIVSAVMSGIGLILTFMDLLSFRKCSSNYAGSYLCSINAGTAVVLSFALVNNLLILCVSVFLGVFGCLSYVPDVPQVFLVQN